MSTIKQRRSLCSLALAQTQHTFIRMPLDEGEPFPMSRAVLPARPLSGRLDRRHGDAPYTPRSQPCPARPACSCRGARTEGPATGYRRLVQVAATSPLRAQSTCRGRHPSPPRGSPRERTVRRAPGRTPGTTRDTARRQLCQACAQACVQIQP